MQNILDFLRLNPEWVAIIWPIFTGILSFAYRRLAARHPVIVAVLRASGLDLPALGEALRKRIEEKKSDE